MTDLQFADLALSDTTMSALEEMGYVEPTPVQASAIPLVSTGRDLMVQSQTGTGKTAAFGIPLMERLGDKPGRGIRGLVLCPTRELAKQVSEEFARLGKFKGISTVPVYGGASLDKQVAEMRFAHVVVGTPGRVLDHLRRKTLSLNGLDVLILDEADEMLSMGFAQELDAIMRFVPQGRQTLLFSATIPEDIKRYAKRFMNEPEFLSLIEEQVAATDVEHHYYMVSGVGRQRELVQVLEFEEPDSAIIFTNTRKDSELVARYLGRQGYDAEYLNGDLPQKERERIMQRAKDKEVRFLVATDVAARGIDISELSHVVNYILPESPEVYIHRTGRTGRAGAKGTAISLVGPREIGVYYYLKRIYNVALQERSVPTQAEIEMRREDRRTEGLIAEIFDAAGETPADPALRAEAMRLLEREESVEVVQALLRLFRRRGASPAKRLGGMLDDVPKPQRTAPGSLPQTLAGVAERVAIVQSEYRGRPAEKAPASAKAPAPPAPADEPAERQTLAQAPAPEPEKTAEAAPADADATADAASAAGADEPPRRRRRRRGAEDEAPAPAAEAAAPAAAEAEAEDEQPANDGDGRRRRRRRGSSSTPAPDAEAPAPAREAAPEERGPRGGRTDDAERTERAARPPRGDRAERGERSERSDRAERGERSDRSDRAERSERAERGGRAERGDRSDRAARSERTQDAPRPLEPDHARLFVNLGRRDGMKADALREALAELGGILPEDIAHVELRSRHALVSVHDDFAEDLIEAVNGETLGRRTVRIEFAEAD